uniref:Uncharacterized protein n=1 Tax=Anguilla anguilla TaxID=7936 RepID=A0A0E9R0N8_ANGAN
MSCRSTAVEGVVFSGGNAEIKIQLRCCRWK